MIHTHRERKRERTRETLTNTAIFTTRVFFLNKWESFECEKREFRNNFFVNQIFSRRRSLNTLKLSLLLQNIWSIIRLIKKKTFIRYARKHLSVSLWLTSFARFVLFFSTPGVCLSVCLWLERKRRRLLYLFFSPYRDGFSFFQSQKNKVTCLHDEAFYLISFDRRAKMKRERRRRKRRKRRRRWREIVGMMSRGSVFLFLPLLRFFSGEREREKREPAPARSFGGSFFYLLFFQLLRDIFLTTYSRAEGGQTNFCIFFSCYFKNTERRLTLRFLSLLSLALPNNSGNDVRRL